MKIKIYSLIVLFTCFAYVSAQAWGTDVQVSTVAPQGATSVVANAGGILYASVPQASLNPSGALSIYESTDNGANWMQLNVGAGSPGQIIVKSKMLVTGINQVVCMYLLNDTVYTLDISTGVSIAFTVIAARDFDAAASFSGNAIYLYVDEASTTSIKRYSSTDGGLTWTGSTATVASNAAFPKVYMSGTRLYLAYYGPLQSDTTRSVVRSTYYNETTPGTLVSVAGSFMDIVTGITNQKHQIQHAAVNGVVWFFWTEGTGPSLLKCRVSLDGGDNYGTEFVVAGSATMDVKRFDANHYSNPVSSGIQVSYYADSVQAGAPDPFTESIVYSSADITNSQIFSAPQRVSDFTVDASDPAFNITIITYMHSLTVVAGVLWVQSSGFGSSLYYDASNSIVTGIAEGKKDDNFSFSVYPNPVEENLTLDLQIIQAGEVQIDLRDINGRILVHQQSGFLNRGSEQMTLDLSAFSSGIYFLTLSDEKSTYNRKIVKY